MNRRWYFLVILVLIIGAGMLYGCADSVTDSVTEMELPRIKDPDPSLSKVKVSTDGMLGDFYADYHPFWLGREVWVDVTYYTENEISRGDIVLFSTAPGSDQPTDLARIVGLPYETVIVKSGQVYIDDKKLKTFYGDDSTADIDESMAAPITLQANEYFILADVRWRGFHDSQAENTAFTKDEILGKVVGY